MCGICGTLSFDGRPADPGVLAAMNETLIHRGPDSEGSFVEGPVGLAMRRLSIIDLAGGDQPIGNEDGSVQVIQNGEIYNYRELAEELRARGHTLATSSDTEVIAHLYEDEGPRFVERLRGMFAIAVWDRKRERLVLARDRFGIKPLYVRETAGSLAFASELKALMRLPDFDRELDLAKSCIGLVPGGGPRGARGIPRVQLRADAALDLPRGAQAARRPPARRRGRRDERDRVRALPAGAGRRGP